MAQCPVTVCLPLDSLAERVRVLLAAAASVGPAPPVEMIVWDATSPAPPGLDAVTMAVPAYGRRLSAASYLALLPNVRVVQLLTAGYDGWAGSMPPGVRVCNGAGIHGVSTAELAVALLLASVRDLPRQYDNQRERIWSHRDQIGLTELPVLVLGAGDIGQRVAAAVRPLGASVTLVGRTARDEIRGVGELAQLLPQHRVLVIATPLTEQTRGLIGRAELALLPDDSIIVNVARGAIVDTDALLGELLSGRLRAGLDVTDPEPLPEQHPLWAAPNLILTPHMGGGTRDWPVRAAQLIVEQVTRLVAGDEPAHVVLGP